jgi:uncharacterized membrane protein
MKIPIKYGLLITLGVMAWVIITHNLITNPFSVVYIPGTPIFINLVQFVMLYLGLKALEHEKGERPIFKEGLKTGMAISFVYFVTAALFFAGVIAVVGTKWLASEPGADQLPMSRVVASAYIGLFIGAILFGLIYSTVISFFLAKRRSEE